MFDENWIYTVKNHQTKSNSWIHSRVLCKSDDNMLNEKQNEYSTIKFVRVMKYDFFQHQVGSNIV